MFLLIWGFMLFTSTFTDMVIAGIDNAETGGNVAQLMFSLTLIFCGVLAGPSTLPGFWSTCHPSLLLQMLFCLPLTVETVFMYRVSPFTYLVDGMLSVGLANTVVRCSPVEYLNFNPPPGLNCSAYLEPYISYAGGYLTEASKSATENCQFCTVGSTNDFLVSLNSSYGNRWRNFGLMWAYIAFNVAGAVLLYWLIRVPRVKKEKEIVHEEKVEGEVRVEKEEKVVSEGVVA